MDLEKRHEELLEMVRNLEEQKSIIEGLIKKKAKIPWPWGHPTTHPYAPMTNSMCGSASVMDAPMSMNTSAIMASWCNSKPRGVYCRSLCSICLRNRKGRLTSYPVNLAVLARGLGMTRTLLMGFSSGPKKGHLLLHTRLYDNLSLFYRSERKK